MNKVKVIYAIGLGPGAVDLIVPRARNVIESCDVIAGYSAYLKQFPELFNDKTIISNGMRGEVERCRQALDATLAGHRVAVVSSGDAGIYGMAGLLLELTEEAPYFGIEVETVPGITAASAAGALLGAPLMNDFCVISLSDLLTPAEVIRRRLRVAAVADMVTVLYNPASTRRRRLIQDAVALFLAERGHSCPVGIIHEAARPEQRTMIVPLGEFPCDDIDMNTLVVIGNSSTVIRRGRLYTRRGYQDKYQV